MFYGHREPHQYSFVLRQWASVVSPVKVTGAACCLLMAYFAAVSGNVRAATPPAARPVSLFVAGDVMLGRGAVLDLRRGQTPLQQLAAQSRSADIAFCNLECVFSPRVAAARWKPLLFALPSAARYLRNAGIDLVSMANNHALDAGEVGVDDTVRILRSNGIAEVGMATSGGNSWLAWQKTVGGRRIAWLAASAYGPWRDGNARMRNVADSGLTDQVRTLARSGDAVFVSLHWGNEYSRIVTAGQVQIAHRLIDAGAVAVVGHHPHVIQRIEVYHGRPIFYSLGNFVFDRLPGRAQDGIAAQIVLLPSGQVRFRVLALHGGQLSYTPQCRARLVADKSLPLPLPTGEALVKILPGHFLSDSGGRQVIVWSRKPSGQATIRAFERHDGAWRCLAEGHHPAVFDMQVGDVDRMGRDEIVLGLLQRSKLDVRIARRLFVYEVGGGEFRPRWRGSGLSRPFQSFRLLPTRTGCDLAAVEIDRAPDLRAFEWVSIYRWNGFGFRRLWTSPVRGSVQDLQTGRDRQGSFVTFTQVQPGNRRRLILRRAPAATDALENNTPFVARVLA